MRKSFFVLLLAVLPPSLALAESLQLEEVLVTAQKREQGLQDVPITISTFDRDFLKKANAQSISDLGQHTPSMTLQTTSQGEPNIFIRGIGSNDFGVGGDTSVGVFIDDVYVGRQAGAVSDLGDVERVEVLKGPQGTLFGRNTIGGAISITTVKPGDEFAGAVTLEAGSYDKRRIDAHMDIPLGKSWATRITGIANTRDGHVENDFDGKYLEDQDNSAVRLTTMYRPPNNFQAMFKLAYEELDITSRAVRSSNPDYLPGDPWDNAFSDLSTDGFEKRYLTDASIHLEWTLDNFDIKSITAYRKTNYDSRKDATGTGSRQTRLRTNIQVDAEQFSQELRVNFDNGGALFWFLGASAFYEDITQGSYLESTNETIKFVGPAINDQLALCLAIPACAADVEATLPDGVDYYEYLDNGGESYSYAVYGDSTWAFAPRWELILGLRYSYDKKDHYVDSMGPIPPLSIFGVPVPGFVYLDLPRSENSGAWDAWTPRAVLNWSVTDDSMLYLSASRGYKSGGFNSFTPDNPFDPEFVWSYELGGKLMLWDQRLHFNGSVFYYDYQDLQVNNIEDAKVVLRNAGEAVGKGAEVDVTWLIARGWQLFAAANYLDARFETFDPAIDGVPTDLSGETMPLSPKWQFTGILSYLQSLNNDSQLDYQLSYSWTDEYYFEVGNTRYNPNEYQGAFGLWDARIAWWSPQQHWEIAVFGKNLADEQYLVYAGGLAKYQLNAPITTAAIGRTWGATLTYQF